ANLKISLTRLAFGSLAKFDGSRRAQFRAAHFVPHLVIRRRAGFRIAFERTAIFLGTNDVLGARTGLLLGIHKDVVNVSLAIRHADDLRTRTFRRQLPRQSLSLQPTKT